MKQSIDVTIGMKADTSGADTVRHALGSLSQEAENVNATVKGASLEMGTAMEAARGSTNGIVKLVVALIKRTGHLKDMSLAAVGAIAGAITSLVRLGGAVKDLFSYTFNLGQAPADIRACSSAVYDMQTAAADFAESMKTARADAAELTKSFNAQVDATNKLVKAQNELHRAQALAGATTDEERTRINNAYNALNTGADDSAATQKLDRREKDLNDEEARLRAEIAQAEKDKADAERIAREAGARGSERRTNWFSGMVQGWFGRNPNESAQAAFNTAAGARNLAFEKDEEIDAAKKKLEALKAARAQIDIERKAITATAATHEQQAKNANADLATKVDAERDKVEMSQIDNARNLAKAQNELARNNKLLTATTEEDKVAINAECEALNKKADIAAELQKLAIMDRAVDRTSSGDDAKSKKADIAAKEKALKIQFSVAESAERVRLAEEAAKKEKKAQIKAHNEAIKEQMKAAKKAHEENLRAIEIEKEGAKKLADEWGASAKRARDDAGQKGGGFSRFQHDEKELAREKTREENRRQKAIDRAQKERDRIAARMAKGERGVSEFDKNRLSQLNEYLDKMNDKNPYQDQLERWETEKLKAINGLSDQLDELTKQLGELGL